MLLIIGVSKGTSPRAGNLEGEAQSTARGGGVVIPGKRSGEQAMLLVVGVSKGPPPNNGNLERKAQCTARGRVTIQRCNP